MRFNPQNKKYADYQKDGDFESVKSTLDNYLEAALLHQTRSIDELEKTLWLANAGAATVSIGFIQASKNVGVLQYLGSCGFTISIIMLMAMKYVSSKNTSHGVNRFIGIMDKFMNNEVTDLEFESVRDKEFEKANNLYHNLRDYSGYIFVGGCILTLFGVNPWL